ncbi:MAG: helix-turn-helix transcriptional regulator [Pseudomonadota bacterium]
MAKRVRAKRLTLNLSQQSLALRSGVSYGTLKKFELSGQISLKSLLKLAVILDALEEFENLFPEQKLEKLASLDDLLKVKIRKRGRK